MEKKATNKTKVIAYSRRQRENNTFSDIAEVLPLQENAKDLDKASILRLVINYLKLRDLVKDGSEEEKEGEDKGEEVLQGGDLAPSPLDSQLENTQECQGSSPTITDILPNFSKDVLQALNGFLMVVSQDGKLLFSSDSIASYLGLRQVDVIGLQLQDIVHPQDYSEMSRILQSQGQDFEQVYNSKDALRRKFIVRMRCAFTPSIRSITRCSNFKPVFCSCFLKFSKAGHNKGQFVGMVIFCQLATVSKVREMVVGTFFKTKHKLDLSYTNVDTRIRWILGYDPSEMMGLKAYEYFHPQDLGVTSSCHSYLLSHGISNSPCYRFMTRWGDWVWCRSKSRMLYNKKTQLPEGIVLHTWIVRLAEEDDRMLAIQAKEKNMKTCDDSVTSVSSDRDASEVSTLADALTNSTPVLSIAQIAAANDSSVPEFSLPSPPLSVELSPCQPQVCSPVVKDSQQKGVAYSPGVSTTYSPVSMGFSPSMSVAQSPQINAAYSSVGVTYSSPVHVAHSPPVDMAYSSPVGVAHSPPVDMAYSSPVGVANVSPVGAANSPQMSLAYSPPVGVAYSPQVGVAFGSPNPQLSEYSPNSGSQCSSLDQQQMLSSVADEAFFADQTAPIHQSFSMSPPYTPYSQDQTFYDEKQTPSNYFSMVGTFDKKPMIGSDSPPYSAAYTTPTSYNNVTCVSNITTHTYEHGTPSSALPNYATPHAVTTRHLPLSLMQSSSQLVTTQATATTMDGNQPTMPTNRILSMTGHVTHFCSLSSTPSPQLEQPLLFGANDNSNVFSDYQHLSQSPGNGNMVGATSYNESVIFQLPPIEDHVYPHIKPSIIAETRARYSGTAPLNGGLHAMRDGGQKEVGYVRGRIPRPAAGGHDPCTETASQSISQWSQWLQNGAPEPVC